VLGVNGDWDLFCPAAGGARNVDLFAVSGRGNMSVTQTPDTTCAQDTAGWAQLQSLQCMDR
jgi:hypothetical protein